MTVADLMNLLAGFREDDIVVLGVDPSLNRGGDYFMPQPTKVEYAEAEESFDRIWMPSFPEMYDHLDDMVWPLEHVRKVVVISHD